MAATWPSSIQSLLHESYNEQDIPRIVKSATETGPVKTRVSFTKRRKKVSASILCSLTDYETFSNFFDITLAGGALPFDFKHPITGVLTTWLFEEPPSYSMEGPIYVRASFTWVET